MSNLTVFKHYAVYHNNDKFLNNYAYNKVEEKSSDYTMIKKMILFDGKDSLIITLNDGNYMEYGFNGDNPFVYSCVDLDNPDNYIYLYYAESNKLISKFLILYEYHRGEKMYYVTKKEDGYGHTLMLFDADIEGGKHIKFNRLLYYNIGTTKSCTPVHPDNYRAYINDKRNIVNAKLKEYVTKAEAELEFLDSLLIENGGL